MIKEESSIITSIGIRITIIIIIEIEEDLGTLRAIPHWHQPLIDLKM